MAIRTTVSSTLDTSHIGMSSLSVGQHSNTGATLEDAPVLMSVAADNVVTADQFAALVANDSTDLTTAFVARVLNALGETVADIVDTATAAPNIDFGWGKFMFEIAGSLTTSTETPGIANYCYFKGSVATKYQNQFAQMSAYVDTSANPCDLKRIRDAATSALNTIVGSTKFYAEGRGFTWGTANDKQELYNLDGTKVCNLTLTANDSYPTSLTLALPTTSAITAGEYVLRIDCAILGKVWRMEKKVTLLGGVTPPATPTITKVTCGEYPDDTVEFSDSTESVIHGTNLALGTGDKVLMELYQNGTLADSADLSAGGKVTSSTATQINLSGFPTEGREEGWCAEDADTKIVVVKGGVRTAHAVHFMQ